jgi:hypothetical protein
MNFITLSDFAGVICKSTSAGCSTKKCNGLLLQKSCLMQSTAGFVLTTDCFKNSTVVRLWLADSFLKDAAAREPDTPKT